MLKEDKDVHAGHSSHPEMGIVTKKFKKILLAALDTSSSFSEFRASLSNNEDKDIPYSSKRVGILFRLIRHKMALKHKNDILLFKKYRNIFQEWQSGHALEAVFFDGLQREFPDTHFAQAPHILENGETNFGVDWLTTFSSGERCGIQFTVCHEEEKRKAKLQKLFVILSALERHDDRLNYLRRKDYPSSIWLLAIHGEFPFVSSRFQWDIWQQCFSEWKNKNFQWDILDCYPSNLGKNRQRWKKEDIKSEFAFVMKSWRDIRNRIRGKDFWNHSDRKYILCSQEKVGKYTGHKFQVYQNKKPIYTFTYFPK